MRKTKKMVVKLGDLVTGEKRKIAPMIVHLIGHSYVTGHQRDGSSVSLRIEDVVILKSL
jgi:hypothetical protein